MKLPILEPERVQPVYENSVEFNLYAHRARARRRPAPAGTAAATPASMPSTLCAEPAPGAHRPVVARVAVRERGDPALPEQHGRIGPAHPADDGTGASATWA